MRHVFASCLTVLVLFTIAPVAAVAQVNVGFGGEAHDADQPLEVVSDGLRVNQETGEAVFSGNVIVVQGGLRMTAAEVQVLYSEDSAGAQNVDRVIATGGVLMTQGADTAEGNEAIYETSTGLMRLFGNVLVTQGAVVIAGDTMVVNLETGNGTVDGRVRTILNQSSGNE